MPTSFDSSVSGRREGSASLPITPWCSLNPCSYPQHQSGRDPMCRNAAAGPSSSTNCVPDTAERAAACNSRGCASSAGRSLFFANRVAPPLEESPVETIVSQPWYTADCCSSRFGPTTPDRFNPCFIFPFRISVSFWGFSSPAGHYPRASTFKVNAILHNDPARIHMPFFTPSPQRQCRMRNQATSLEPQPAVSSGSRDAITASPFSCRTTRARRRSLRKWGRRTDCDGPVRLFAAVCTLLQEQPTRNDSKGLCPQSRRPTRPHRTPISLASTRS